MSRYQNTNALIENEVAHSEKSSIEDLLNYHQYHSEFAVCLEPLLKALEWTGELRHLAEAFPHCAGDIDLTDFRNIFVGLQFKSMPLKIKLRELDPRLCPCLFLPEKGPALVVYQKDKDSSYVFNSKNNKEEKWTKDCEGTAYIFSHFNNESKSNNPFNWFSNIFSRFKYVINQVFLMCAVLNIFVLVVPLFIMAVYDRVIVSGSLSMLSSFLIGAMLALCGIFALQWMRAKILVFIGARLDHIVGKVIIEKLLYLPPSLTETAALGAQVSRVKDFDLVREFFTSPLFFLFFEIPFVFIFLFFIWYLGGAIAYIPIIMIFIFLIIFTLINPYVKKSVMSSSKAMTKRQTFQLETLNNLSTIKYCGGESIWNKRYEDLSAEATYKNFLSSLLTSGLNIVADTLMTATGFVTIICGVMLVISGELTVGALIAIMMLVWRVIAPAKKMLSSVTKISQVVSSIKQINNLMNLPSERAINTLSRPLNKIKGKVTFNRVSFRYQADTIPALAGISFNIQAGEIVCVIGRNGSGKSTLLKLIPKMYSPQVGSIWIDNHDVRQKDAIELRHAVAYLPQNPHFFYGTLEQNLRLANPTATIDQMMDATKKANVFQDIMALDNGFKTRIRDCKLPFSDVFLKKIALARIYLKKANLILLDEPCTGFDQVTDRQFLQTLESMHGKCTIFMVTHRPSHLKIADKILFLDQGQLIQQGEAKEIMSRLSLEYI